MTTQRTVRYDPNATYDVREFDREYLNYQGQSRQVRVYQPQGDGPFPVLLSVHGGAWSSGNHENNPVTTRPIAASGVLVAAIGLRVAPEFPYPAQVQDTNYGTRWLKQHASEFNGDPTTIGAIGYSSGGHTLPLSAMRPNDPQYNAIPLDGNADATVGWMGVCWPVIDPYVRHMISQSSGNAELSAKNLGYFLSEEAMHEANPVEMLDRGEQCVLPPALVIHGTADTNVPFERAERFCSLYNEAGGRAQLEAFADQPHSFGNTPGPQSDRLVEVVKAYIASFLES